MTVAIVHWYNNKISNHLYTATVWMPRLLAVLMTLQAISPRLAINTFEIGLVLAILELEAAILSLGSKSL